MQNGLTVRAAACVVASLGFAAAAHAADIPETTVEPAVVAPEKPWMRWESWSDPCAGTCRVTVFGGQYIATSMSSIFTRGKIFTPWDWKTKDSGFIGGSVAREFLALGDDLVFEAEAGVGKRFGDLHAGEGWVAMYARWKAFPWNDVIRTSAAISTGLNYATEIDGAEREKASHTSHLLHYLSPEITLGLPDQPNWDIVLRFHHRSGGKLAVFNKNSGGAQYQTIGLRYTW